MSTPCSSEMHFILLSVIGIHTPPGLAHRRQGAVSPDSLLPAMFQTLLELEHGTRPRETWEKIQFKDCYYVPLKGKSLTHPPHSEQAGTTIQVLGVGRSLPLFVCVQMLFDFFYSLLSQTHLSFLII